jgi:hypothetical protein
LLQILEEFIPVVLTLLRQLFLSRVQFRSHLFHLVLERYRLLSVECVPYSYFPGVPFEKVLVGCT